MSEKAVEVDEPENEVPTYELNSKGKSKGQSKKQIQKWVDGQFKKYDKQFEKMK